MQAAVAAVIFAVTLIAIVVRPLRINETWFAAAGAVLMLAAGVVTPLAAAQTVVSEWNLFLFFLGLMLTAAVADMARFFDWIAALAAGAAGSSGRRLLLNVILIAALVTAFLSNDATAIILTPVVYAMTTRLRVRVTPYLLAVSFTANAASMTLPISNPINVLVGERLRAPLGEYELHLLPASVAAIAITAAVFMAIFWRTVDRRLDFAWRAARAAAAAERGFFYPVLAGLIVLAVTYVIASALLWPLGVVATAGGLVLCAIALARRRLSPELLKAHVSPALFIYIAALFVLIRAVQDVGLTTVLVAGAVSRASDAATAVAGGLVGTAVTSNLVNNLPAVLVFVSGAQTGGVAAALRAPFLFGALAGADLGPNLTPVGALSTMLWLVIVRRSGVEVSAWDFFRIGVIVTPLTLMVAGILIAVSFR